MCNRFLKNVLILSLSLTVAACADSLSSSLVEDDNFSSKEKLYESTQNYSGLVTLYREQLKSFEDDATRYKLARAYYNKGDYEASLYQVKPLTDVTNSYYESASLLEVRDLIQLKNFDNALMSVNSLIERFPKNAEAHNLRGVIFAQQGNMQRAQQDIAAARDLFINDVIAVNNLAMLKIIHGDYKNAVQLLLPQYLKGVKESRLVHNLVFALVKSGDTEYALDIIKKERLNSSPNDLVAALKKNQGAFDKPNKKTAKR
ncbi:tetratricopeptide repeat protein [Caviibacterium pharyngocola]|uniref:NrfG protein n=1 Tax=Caviibacterium pharyngocola TaxID=28159 RepID=A0A2M8RWW3_9PAST|nr:tetratricopeptide repeat protein [Caviibacterium pharyngocola]PJG83361.1 NrfG protein [Caviibacterium pharyngocola]